MAFPVRMRWLVAAVSAAWIAATGAGAEGIAGSGDRRFGAAVALWLDDDEAVALPTLAALAGEGNRAAQVLLTLIDETPVYQGPWLARLPREARIALMRAPGGLSGRSWMLAAAEDTAFARLWLAWQRPTSTAATAMDLAALGEDRAARLALHALSMRQYRDFAAVAGHPDFPEGMRYLVWLAWARDGAGDRALAEIAGRMPGDPEVGRFAARTVTPAERDAWLAIARLARPLRQFCRAVCPDSPETACVRAALMLVGNEAAADDEALALLGTPAEALIPSESWEASRRGQLSVLRPVAARAAQAYRLHGEVTAADPCVGKALSAETARYYQ